MPPVRRLLGAAVDAGEAAWTVGRSGLFGPHLPWQLAGYARGLRRWGLTLGGVYAVGAARNGGARAAVYDDDGEISFAAMDQYTDTIAAGLADLGVGSGDDVAVLCRNHRGFVIATVALAKLGADTIYLNTGFAGPQLRNAVAGEGAGALILDAEFLELAEDLGESMPLVVTDGPDQMGAATFASLLAGGPRPGPPAPGRVGRQTILTSGTTGAPRGARREPRRDARPALAMLSLLSRIPYRVGDTTVLAAPMFHAWGLANLALGLAFAGTLVLSRRFDAEDVLARIERDRATVLVAVPVMLQRIMELPAPVLRRYDTSSLRVVGLSGSALPGELAVRFMDTFGDVVYNLYGSTEVGWVSIAGPKDLRAAPDTAGRVPFGTEVRLLDSEGGVVAGGEQGRIFVRSGTSFEGYTGGGGKEVIDGFMATGDLGHFDGDGRLFVDGRDDDMIVSGGENVFPREVEDLLFEHPAVADVAVIGVPDDQFGQRLKAFVVRRPGADADEEALRGHVQRHLARYKVPRELVFVDELPRNSTGKVLKRELT